MGIHNREYMRDEYSPLSGGGMRGRDIVKTLIIINVVVFVAQIFLKRDLSADRVPIESEQELRSEYEQLQRQGRLSDPVMEEWFMLDPHKVMYGQVWRLTTYDFLHSTQTIFHLLFNMLILFMAGRRVEAKYGSGEFLAFYLLAGILSGIVFLLWGVITNNPAPAIGASGAVVAVMIVYALNWPRDTWLLFGIIPMPVIWIAVLMAVMDVWPMLQELAGTGSPGGIAHAAHVGGMVFGFFYVRRNWRVMKWMSSLPDVSRINPFRRRPKLRVHHPEMETPSRPAPIPPHVEARVDQLLAKISEQGEASLTEEERQFLADTSRQYRNRG